MLQASILRALNIVRAVIVFFLVSCFPLGASHAEEGGPIGGKQAIDAPVDDTGKISAYFFENVGPLDPDLHRALLRSYRGDDVPAVGGERLLKLHQTRPGNGTILWWNVGWPETNALGAHGGRQISVSIPFILSSGRRRVEFNGPIDGQDVYSVYSTLDMFYEPIAGCLGVASAGSVTLERTQADRIEAEIDVVFTRVRAYDWRRDDDYCPDTRVQEKLSFLRG